MFERLASARNPEADRTERGNLAGTAPRGEIPAKQLARAISVERFQSEPSAATGCGGPSSVRFPLAVVCCLFLFFFFSPPEFPVLAHTPLGVCRRSLTHDRSKAGRSPSLVKDTGSAFRVQQVASKLLESEVLSNFLSLVGRARHLFAGDSKSFGRREHFWDKTFPTIPRHAASILATRTFVTCTFRHGRLPSANFGQPSDDL